MLKGTGGAKDFKRLNEDFFRIAEMSLLQVDQSEFVQHLRCEHVSIAEDPSAYGQRLLVERFRLFELLSIETESTQRLQRSVS